MIARRIARVTRRSARGGSPLLLGLLVASITLPGCGTRLVGQRSDPTARPAEPRLTDTQRKIVEAREQSSLAPQEPYWPYRLGQVYLEADSSARAEAALRTALRRDPTYPPALALLSRLYYATGRHPEAVEMLEAARTRATGAAPKGLIGGLALHYQAMGRQDLATALVNSASGDDGDGSHAAMVYVTLRGDHPEAADDLARAALDEDPRSAVNQNNYGITRLRAGDPRGARSAFLKAIEIDPDLPGPYYNLAILERFYLFDDPAAERWLAAYRQRSSEDPDGLFRAGATATKSPAAKEEKR